MSETLTVIAGIPPGESGTGRMMRQLIAKGASSAFKMRFIYRARPQKPLRPLLKTRNWSEISKVLLPYALGNLKFYIQIISLFLLGRGKLLIMHPQTLGFGLTNLFLRRWPDEKLYLYVLDSSYFCVRSYNYVPGEVAPCLRCLGGAFQARSQMGCAPFPVKDPKAVAYVDTFLAKGRTGGIRLLSQNNTQMAYIKQHLGDRAKVKVVGLWGEEWTDAFTDWNRRDDLVEASAPKTGPIVIHSFYVPAKGADWFLDVARRCPELTFFCPFPKAKAIVDAPPNVTFKFLTWETGLAAALKSASLVVVPSLWSAPIEGALVKSIVANPRTAIIDNASAFQSEVPSDVALRLSGDPAIAADQLKTALAQQWQPDPAAHLAWVTAFQKRNVGFVDHILKYMTDDAAWTDQGRELK